MHKCSNSDCVPLRGLKFLVLTSLVIKNFQGPDLNFLGNNIPAGLIYQQ